MSELNLYRINNFYSPKRKARNIRRCSGLRIFTERVYTKNTPRSPCGERGAKTKLVFTAARSLQSRSYAAGGARYLQRRPYTPDTRGVCFQGPSRALWYLISRCGASHGTKHRPGSEISQNAYGGCCTSAHHLLGWMRFSASYRCIAQ